MNSIQSITDLSSKFTTTNCNNNNIYQYRPDSGSSQYHNQHNQDHHHRHNRSIDGSNNNIALIKIGEASALPVMLCGIMQNKELFYQQAQNIQKQILLAQSQSSPDSFKGHRNSISSA